MAYEDHNLYTDADKDAPEQIKDGNGEVVLGLCKVCGRAEIELEEPCTPRAAWQPAVSGPRWRPEVIAFADAMERKLKANDHKQGWKQGAPHYLIGRIGIEVGELIQSLEVEAKADGDFYAAATMVPLIMAPLRRWGPHLKLNGDPANILDEAADVANFAMMVADVFGALKTEEPQ